jgi:hypothetical protein
MSLLIEFHYVASFAHIGQICLKFETDNIASLEFEISTHQVPVSEFHATDRVGMLDVNWEPIAIICAKINEIHI